MVVMPPPQAGQAMPASRSRSVSVRPAETSSSRALAGTWSSSAPRRSSEVAVNSRARSTSASDPDWAYEVSRLAYALAGLLGERVEGVRDRLLRGRVVVGRQGLELGETGLGVGEQGAATRRVVAGEAHLGRLDAALDGVEGLAGQGRLRRHRHGRGGADDRGAAEQDGHLAVATAGRHGQPIRGGCRSGGLRQEDGVGLGHQALAQRPGELGSRHRVGHGAQVGDEGEERCEALDLTVGEGSLRGSGEERLELVGTPLRREKPCHGCRPV